MDLSKRKKTITNAEANGEYYVPLQGKQLLIRRKEIPLEYLVLDPANQRIQYMLRSENISPTDVVAIEERMWEEDYVKNLSHSIESNGGLLNPLMITIDGTVLEGNSRLVALRQIKRRLERKGFSVPVSILMPPCEILPDEVNRIDLLWLLAEFHIAGKHKWDPYEQAETIYNLYYGENQPINKIAQHLRLKEKTVLQKMDAYDLMKEYLNIYKGKGQISKWSYFEEFYKKSTLVNRISPGKINYDPNFKKNLFSWINDNKIKGEDIRDLENILSVPKAKEILDQKGFKAAQKYLEKIKPEVASTFFKTVSQLNNQIDHLTERDIEELMEFDGYADQRIKMLWLLSSKLERLLDNIGVNADMEAEVVSG